MPFAMLLVSVNVWESLFVDAERCHQVNFECLSNLHKNLSPLLFGSFCESGTGRGALWSSLNQRDRLSPALILLFLLLLIPVQYLTTTDKYKIKYQDTNANTRYSSPLILLSLHPLILVHLPYLAYVLIFLNCSLQANTIAHHLA